MSLSEGAGEAGLPREPPPSEASSGGAWSIGDGRNEPGLQLHLGFQSSSVNLLDLKQVELDRGLAAEHVDQHLELALLRVDLVDLAVEVRERPVDDTHRLADLELDPDLRRLLAHLLLDRPYLFLLQGHGAVRGADEARHARRVAHDEP